MKIKLMILISAAFTLLNSKSSSAAELCLDHFSRLVNDSLAVAEEQITSFSGSKVRLRLTEDPGFYSFHFTPSFELALGQPLEKIHIGIDFSVRRTPERFILANSYEIKTGNPASDTDTLKQLAASFDSNLLAHFALPQLGRELVDGFLNTALLVFASQEPLDVVQDFFEKEFADKLSLALHLQEQGTSGDSIQLTERIKQSGFESGERRLSWEGQLEIPNIPTLTIVLSLEVVGEVYKIAYELEIENSAYIGTVDKEYLRKFEKMKRIEGALSDTLDIRNEDKEFQKILSQLIISASSLYNHRFSEGGLQNETTNFNDLVEKDFQRLLEHLRSKQEYESILEVIES